MRTWITGAVLVSFALSCGLTLGCSPSGTSTPTSSQTTGSNVAWVEMFWLNQKVGNTIATVSPLSHSMVPTLDSTSILLLEQPVNIVVGDICTYSTPRVNLPVVHRVREIKDGFYLFDGDDNMGADGFIPASALRARVAGVLYGHP